MTDIITCVAMHWLTETMIGMGNQLQGKNLETLLLRVSDLFIDHVSKAVLIIKLVDK